MGGVLLRIPGINHGHSELEVICWNMTSQAMEASGVFQYLEHPGEDESITT
jgi:hypothetical protein